MSRKMGKKISDHQMANCFFRKLNSLLKILTFAFIFEIQGSNESINVSHLRHKYTECMHIIPQFSSVQSLSHLRLLATPWTAAHQASLSITSSQSLFKLMPIESVMPSSHLILCHPLLLLPRNPSHHQGLFQWVNSSHEVAKVLEFQFQHQSFQWT